jgi:hypothetical protein
VAQEPAQSQKLSVIFHGEVPKTVSDPDIELAISQSGRSTILSGQDGAGNASVLSNLLT